MSEYTFEEIKGLLLQCIEQFQCEAELRLKFAGRPYEYMIIIYDDHCSFQRCGIGEQGGRVVLCVDRCAVPGGADRRHCFGERLGRYLQL